MALKEVIIQWLEKKACKHIWKIHNTSSIYSHTDSIRPHTINQTLICKNCGDIKKIELT